MSELYRVLPKDGQPVQMSKFNGAKTCHYRTDEPERPHVPTTYHYCENSECVVRDVETRMKLHGEPLPVQLRCPVCGQTMKHFGFVGRETLLLVKE